MSEIRITARSSIAPAVDPLRGARQERADERKGEKLLDAALAGLVIVVLFIVCCLPPPAAA